jgi:hypothetical protein
VAEAGVVNTMAVAQQARTRVVPPAGVAPCARLVRH